MTCIFILLNCRYQCLLEHWWGLFNGVYIKENLWWCVRVYDLYENTFLINWYIQRPFRSISFMYFSPMNIHEPITRKYLYKLLINPSSETRLRSAQLLIERFDNCYLLKYFHCKFVQNTQIDNEITIINNVLEYVFFAWPQARFVGRRNHVCIIVDNREYFM